MRVPHVACEYFPLEFEARLWHGLIQEAAGVNVSPIMAFGNPNSTSMRVESQTPRHLE